MDDLKLMCIIHIICQRTVFLQIILMVFWWYSDGICPKIHIYTNVFDLAFFYTYTNYGTRFLLISWVCICTSQDNDTHVFGRFFHLKNPLYFIDFFKTKKIHTIQWPSRPIFSDLIRVIIRVNIHVNYCKKNEIKRKIMSTKIGILKNLILRNVSTRCYGRNSTYPNSK